MAQHVFGSGFLFATPIGADSSADGPVPIAALRGVTVDIAFTAKLLHDNCPSWPVAAGRGGAKVQCKADFARFTAAAFNGLFFGGADPGVGMTRTVVDEPQTITAGAATAAYAAGLLEDLGVIGAADGSIYTRVAAGPVGLQYTTDDAGAYGFDTARNGAAVLLSYTRDDTTTGRRLSWANRALGYTPRFSAVLSSTFNGKAITLTLPACASSKMTLQSKLEDFTVPSFSFHASADESGLVGTLSMEEGADTAEPSDPHWPYVIFLMRYNGNFIDISPLGQTFTNTGFTTTSTGALFGESADVNGSNSTGSTNNLLSDAARSEYDIHNGDVTMEAFIRINSAFSGVENARPIFAVNPSSGGESGMHMMAIQPYPGGTALVYFHDGIGGSTDSVSVYIPHNTWVHVACSRVGSSAMTHFLIDGDLVKSETIFGIGTAPSNKRLCVGNRWGGNEAGDISMEEGRVTLATRYTEPFTIPASAYPNR